MNCKLVLSQYMKSCVLLLSTIVWLASCATVKLPPPAPPQLEYFQGRDSLFPAPIETIASPISRIQKGDILGIIVSSLSRESNEILNFYNTNSLPLTSFSPGGKSGGTSSQPLGYAVDSLGNVSIPLIGKQKLEGMTIQQAEDKIRTEVEKKLKDPTVSIRFINHKFTVLGEVAQAGTFNLQNDQTTLIDAITAAGDLTIFGKRDSIKVIRTIGSRREIGFVSLRTRAVFASPYFYIRNDDIIYIEPTKDKLLPQPQPPQPKQPNLFVQRAPFYLSFLTTIISLVFLFKR